MTIRNSAARMINRSEADEAQNTSERLTAVPLNETHEAEVLSFLSARPLHTFYMAGLIRDNGVVSPLNRGDFYGRRNSLGQLEGVALVGHATIVEARTPDALRALASVAQGCRSAHVIVGEQETIEQFWHHYSEGGRAPRMVCRELLLEKRWPTEVLEAVSSLRPAAEEDLELVVPVHAQMAFEGSGVNPLRRDADGFRLRCARRIRQGRVWVVVEAGRLVFKADVVSDTPAVAYLEGVYVAPEERHKGFGLRCLTQLCCGLLARTRSVGLLVNEKNSEALRFYERAGFKLQNSYDTVYLQQES